MKQKLLSVILGWGVLSILNTPCFSQEKIVQKPEIIPHIKQVKPYLMFPGTCRQALKFYKECFNGSIVKMKTFGESSITVTKDLENRIFNSELRAGNLHLMASDYLSDNDITTGSNFALFVFFSDSTEKKKVFTRLSEGGEVLFPIEDNFGMLVDKFGIQWMVESGE